MTKLLATLLSVSLFSLVGCAAEPEEMEEEEQGSTDSEMQLSAGSQVVQYARKNLCEVSGNHIVQLDCPIATDPKVWKFAKDKLGKKAYRCGGAAYAICLNY